LDTKTATANLDQNIHPTDGYAHGHRSGDGDDHSNADSDWYDCHVNTDHDGGPRYANRHCIGNQQYTNNAHCY
jgi:hypothetical protein